MTDQSSTGPSEQRSEAGGGPITLSQLQATGAEVVGSDGEKVGDLKEVGDADFLVERTLRRDIRVPVNRVQEVTGENKVVLDVRAEEVQEIGEKEPLSDKAPGEGNIAHSAEKEKGIGGLKREKG
jgi:sporulation protein YlmC with PRC-barrel domain